MKVEFLRSVCVCRLEECRCEHAVCAYGDLADVDDVQTVQPRGTFL